MKQNFKLSPRIPILYYFSISTNDKEAYEAAPYWRKYKEIIEIGSPTDLEIADGELLDIIQTQICDEFTYTRTFKSKQWQSLYVPFAISVDSFDDAGGSGGINMGGTADEMDAARRRNDWDLYERN